MRLGQLSRKLDVDSSAIVNLLNENFREVNNHPNIKISEEELEFITNHFAPEVVEPEIVNSEPTDTEVVEVKEEIQEPKEAEQVKEEEAKPAFIESLRPKVITLEDQFNEQKKELESFKAEKPELEGLRVVGKIDLPEPKPKAPKEPKEESTPAKGTQTINERGVRQRHNKRKGNKRNSNRNPVEYERKRAELEAKKKKEQEQKWHKEQKKKHYEENVKSKIADKPKKKKKKKFIEQKMIEAQASNPTKQTQKPKSALGRFWRWLNGGYDKFD